MKSDDSNTLGYISLDGEFLAQAEVKKDSRYLRTIGNRLEKRAVKIRKGYTHNRRIS